MLVVPPVVKYVRVVVCNVTFVTAIETPLNTPPATVAFVTLGDPCLVRVSDALVMPMVDAVLSWLAVAVTLVPWMDQRHPLSKLIAPLKF